MVQNNKLKDAFSVWTKVAEVHWSMSRDAWFMMQWLLYPDCYGSGRCLQLQHERKEPHQNALLNQEEMIEVLWNSEATACKK